MPAGELDASEFVTAVKERLAAGGLCVCALDTDFLGHWWYEGPLWRQAVIEEADRQHLTLTSLNADTVARHSDQAPDLDRSLPASSWGEHGDLRTWSAPPVADLAWPPRRAELQTFLAYRDWAAEYPRQRASGHAAQLARALNAETEKSRVRNLAPHLELSYS